MAATFGQFPANFRFSGALICGVQDTPLQSWCPGHSSIVVVCRMPPPDAETVELRDQLEKLAAELRTKQQEVKLQGRGRRWGENCCSPTISRKGLWITGREEHVGWSCSRKTEMEFRDYVHI